MRLPRSSQSVGFRLIVFTTLMSIASVSVMALTVLYDVQSTLVDQIEQRIEDSTRFLVNEYATEGIKALAEIIDRQSNVVGGLEYRLESPTGEYLAGALPTAQRKEGWTHLKLPPNNVPGNTGNKTALAYVTILAGGELLIVGESLARVSQAEQAILNAVVVAVLMVLVVSLIGALILRRVFSRRIEAMAVAAQGVMRGDLTRRIPGGKYRDELGWLAAVFNHMLDRISALIDLNRQIGADIAHDLRSPLSHLLRRLDEARARASSIEDYEAATEAAIADVNQVLSTFNAILRIAQIETGSRRSAFESVDLQEVADGVVDAFLLAAAEDGKVLALHADTGIRVHGDRQLLLQLIANLIENALRHTPKGTHIDCRIVRSSSGVVLIVADDGPGVPEEDRIRVLERFARLDRSRSTPGSGLGLTLCAAIVELHDGSIRLEDNRPGLKVTVELPVP